MSLKKELLSKLSEEQLKEFAESKSLTFTMNDQQKEYYKEWSEKDRLIDMINDKHEITVKEIEDLIRSYQG